MTGDGVETSRIRQVQPKKSRIMTYAYIRYSTDKQDEQEQVNAIEDYAKAKGLTIDDTDTDRGVSGKVTYRERRVYQMITEWMERGDTLIVTEISRLGRSMSDVHDLIIKELKPRGIRLIVIKAGIDLDCNNIKAIDEMLLMALSFSAQMEREMTSERTREALKARKKRGEQIGGTNELWGSRTGRTDRGECLRRARKSSGEKRRETAANKTANLEFKDQVDLWVAQHGEMGRFTDWNAFCLALNRRGIKTPTGLEYTPVRARAALQKIARFY